MLVKKAPNTSGQPNLGRKQELDYLYARRSAIDDLIRTLQEYDLSRMRWTDYSNKQQSA
jgi:hypothetical protein